MFAERQAADDHTDENQTADGVLCENPADRGSVGDNWPIDDMVDEALAPESQFRLTAQDAQLSHPLNGGSVFRPCFRREPRLRPRPPSSTALIFCSKKTKPKQKRAEVSTSSWDFTRYLHLKRINTKRLESMARRNRYCRRQHFDRI